MKALLVHGADWSDAWEKYEATLKNPGNRRTFREYVARFLGYGSANVARVLACTEQRVTVLGFGDLRDGDASEFRLPLPPSLSAETQAETFDRHLGLAVADELRPPELPGGAPVVQTRITRSLRTAYAPTTVLFREERFSMKFSKAPGQ